MFYRRPVGAPDPVPQVFPQAGPQAALQPHVQQGEGQAWHPPRGYPEHQEKVIGNLATTVTTRPIIRIHFDNPSVISVFPERITDHLIPP